MDIGDIEPCHSKAGRIRFTKVVAQTKRFFFGVTYLKCLISVYYDISNLSKAFFKLVGLLDQLKKTLVIIPNKITNERGLKELFLANTKKKLT